MNYKLSRLILIPTKKPPTTAEVFISNPQIDQEAILGKLFVICEIESNKSSALKIINFFISNLPANYYQNEKISLKEKMGTIKVGEIFENALMETNNDLQNFLRKEKIKINPRILNMAVGVICKNDLFFSTVGKIKSLLIYSESSEDGRKIYKITNVEEPALHEKNSSSERSNKVNLTKLFAHVTEGKIPLESYFLFANELLPEYISNKQLTKIITTLPPGSAVEQIKNQLYKINSYVTFLAILIKNSSQQEVREPAPMNSEYISADVSLEKMGETEAETSRYLSPAGMVNTNKYVQKIKYLWQNIIISRSEPLGAQNQLRDKVLFQRKSRTAFLKKLINMAKSILIFLLNITSYILNNIMHPGRLIYKIKKLWRRIKMTILQTLRWFLQLSTMNKVIILVALLFLTAFAYSLKYAHTKKVNEEISQDYEQSLEIIGQKQNQVDASLLYNNEERAYELINEVTALIDKIAAYEKADQAIINEFNDKKNKQMEKLSRVIKLAPKELANFAHLNQQANPQEIYAIDNKVSALDPNNSSVYQLNLENNTINLLSDKMHNIKHSVLANNNILLVSSQKRIVINEEGEISSIDISLIDSDNSITSVYYYNSRLYILSSPQNQIYRFSNNYNTKDSWIKEEINMQDAIDMAIDGYVYILKNNGKLIKLLSGYSKEFELGKINPVFQNPAKIKVSKEGEGFIYILEPVNQRLVVFDKDGNFLLQYKIEQFTNLKDFIVIKEEEGGKILFLNGTAVYEVEAEHLL